VRVENPEAAEVAPLLESRMGPGYLTKSIDFKALAAAGDAIRFLAVWPE